MEKFTTTEYRKLIRVISDFLNDPLCDWEADYLIDILNGNTFKTVDCYEYGKTVIFYKLHGRFIIKILHEGDITDYYYRYNIDEACKILRNNFEEDLVSYRYN